MSYGSDLLSSKEESLSNMSWRGDGRFVGMNRLLYCYFLRISNYYQRFMYQICIVKREKRKKMVYLVAMQIQEAYNKMSKALIFQMLSRNSIILYLTIIKMVWWPFGKKANDQHSQDNPEQSNPFFGSPSTQQKTFFRSYSSSRTCRPDQEDPNFIICKEKVQDGNESYQKEERIPANEYSNSNSSFSYNLNSSDAQFSDFMNQSANMFRSAHNMFSMFDNFFNINPAFNTEQRHQGFMPAYYQQKNQSRPQNSPQNKRENPRYYFSTKNQADYSVKDL